MSPPLASLPDGVEHRPVERVDGRHSRALAPAPAEAGKFWALVLKNELEAPVLLSKVSGPHRLAGIPECSWEFSRETGNQDSPGQIVKQSRTGRNRDRYTGRDRNSETRQTKTETKTEIDAGTDTGAEAWTDTATDTTAQGQAQI